MNYADNIRQTKVYHKQYTKTQQITSLQNNQQKSQCLQDFNTKSTHWFQSQKRCFIIFWMNKFLECPSKIYSFYAPLARNNYFKQMSDLLSNQLGRQFYKSPSQCKTRFTSIKRKVKNQKFIRKIKQKYDFIDYILEQCQQILKQEQYQHKIALQHKINQLQSLRNSQSQTMYLTKKLIRFQHDWQVQFKNNCIYQYLSELQRYNQNNQL